MKNWMQTIIADRIACIHGLLNGKTDMECVENGIAACTS